MTKEDYMLSVYDALKNSPTKALCMFFRSGALHCALGVHANALGGIAQDTHEYMYGYAKELGKHIWRAAERIFCVNDDFEGTPEERYAFMVRWFEKELKLEPAEPIGEKNDRVATRSPLA